MQKSCKLQHQRLNICVTGQRVGAVGVSLRSGGVCQRSYEGRTGLKGVRAKPRSRNLTVVRARYQHRISLFVFEILGPRRKVR